MRSRWLPDRCWTARAQMRVAPDPNRRRLLHEPRRHSATGRRLQALKARWLVLSPAARGSRPIVQATVARPVLPPSRIQRLRKLLEPPRCVPVPLGDRIRRPFRRLVGVTIGACVGSAEFHRQVGTRNADTMISTRVDDHVRARWHVTLDASRAGRSNLVKVMRRRIILLRRVTLRANTVALGPKPRTVRLVTIAARHAGMEHPALDEGSVLVVLLLYLAVGEIMVVVEQCYAVIVAHRLSVYVVFVNLAAPRMASRARLDFPL